ncbi:hypothetical protein Pen01_34990 [Phytomonospora endophytica]|nr:hypothetical protein Pen01_34990 [Phytomonospora endophytica]
MPQPGGKPTAGQLTPKQAKVGGLIVLGVAAVLLLCVCGFAVNAIGGDDDGDGGGDATPVGAQATPTATPSRTASPSATPSKTPSPSPTPSKKKPPPPPDTDPKYGTCKDAIAAGYGPYEEGVDPEYYWYRDADGDGVVCEPPRDDDGDDGGGDDPPDDPGTDPRFDTCKAANAAGYGPYVRGQDPEYDWYQDRDGDGVVCET